jgi:hypothetical protein
VWKQSSAELPPVQTTWAAFGMSLPDIQIVRLVNPFDDRFNGSRRLHRPETLVHCFAMSTWRRFSVFLVKGCAFWGV